MKKKSSKSRRRKEYSEDGEGINIESIEKTYKGYTYKQQLSNRNLSNEYRTFNITDKHLYLMTQSDCQNHLAETDFEYDTHKNSYRPIKCFSL